MSWHPRIRTILLLVNIGTLAVMVGGFSLLRVFENSLVQQTETELNTQAVFISALYKAFYSRQKGKVNDMPLRINEAEVQWQPLESTLDISSAHLLDEQPIPLPYTGEISDDETEVGRSLVRILQEVQIQTLASIRIVNADGVVISSTNLTNNISLSNRPEVMAALKGNRQALLRKRKLTHDTPSAHSISRSADFRVYVIQPIEYQGKVIAAVVLSRTPKNLYQLLGRYKLSIAAYVFFVLLTVWIIATLTSFTIKKPIIALMEQADRAKRGEKRAVTPLKQPGTHEIMQLSASVADMAQVLEQRADYIMEFLSHVSHEFKTPVTAIQGAVELLIDHHETMTDQQRQRFLFNLQQDSMRIEKLVYRLLDLAKADLKTKSLEHTLVNPSLSRLVSQYSSHTISITQNNRSASANIDNLAVNIDQSTFDSIFGNLIDNAIQANATQLFIGCEVDNQYLSVHVVDNGDDISENNRDKMFEPFFTTHRDTGGTGLGLSIIKSLLKAQSGSIQFAYRDQMPWCDYSKTFVISLPIVKG